MFRTHNPCDIRGSTIILQSSEKKAALLCQQHHTLMLFTFRSKHAAYVVIFSKMAPGWREEDELLNKVVISVFFCAQKVFYRCPYYVSEPWSCRILAVYGGSESSRISSKISSFVFRWWMKLLRVWTAWGWVINDRIFTFGWTTVYIFLQLSFFLQV